MSDKADMWGWACVTIVAVALISGVIYYNIIAPSITQLSYEHKEKKLEFQKSMIKEYGVSPAVLECLERDRSKVSVYQICEKVLSNHKLTREGAQRLVDRVKELDK